LPYAPGTWGSIAGLLVVALIKPDDFILLLTVLILFLLGVITAHKTEKLLGKDSTHIVVDELCGYLLSVVFVQKTIGYLIAAFFLFRIFDVIKPPPIRRLEINIPGGAGIMLDDILAAVYTNICLQLWRLFF